MVVPTYNVEKYLERCLHSVIGQTFNGKVECIVVNDGSTDNSMAAANRIISDYHGTISFSVLHHSHNRGLSAARNTGLQAAIGDYVFFLDSDDALCPDCLRLLAAPIESDPTIEMVMGNRMEIPDGSTTPSVIQKMQLADLVTRKAVRYRFLNEWMSVSACNKLIRREFLIKNKLFFKEGLLHEDLLWMHFAMKCLNHLYIIPDVTYIYYRRPQSITTGIREEERAYHKGMIYEEIARSFTAGEEAKEALHYFSAFCSLLCRHPMIPSYQRAAPLYIHALSLGGYDKERFLLSTIVAFSNTALGRWALTETLVLRRSIKSIFNTRIESVTI